MTSAKLSSFTILDILLYSSTILAIEMTKTFNLVGSAAVKGWSVWDWMIELVAVWAVAGVVIKAYFDKSFVERKDEATTEQVETEPKKEK